MRHTTKFALAGALGLALLLPQDLHAQAMIYPNAGQTPEQLNQDRTTCDTQAAAQTGYHPSQPVAQPAPTKPAAGQRLAGAARGAARGTVVEGATDKSEREIEDPTAAGAKLGAAAGGARQRQERRETRRETQQQQQAQAQKQAAYTQSFTSCMAAKGYTVQ